MKELEFTTYVKRPEMLEKSVQACVPHWTINIDSRQIENELGILVYKQEVVRLEGELTYDKIVSAIINAKYSIDDQTAILMNAMNPNLLTEEKEADYYQEMKDFQAWRDKAKNIASVIMDKLPF
ncbi:hypothetical protein [Bacteroides difficilis]|uniref:HMA domain-containing protein n=1 Tax=Bacteroides difficilis TaxID=2763021 RepID=A0ABR7CEH5_9BACE|nr:hypothetical protein [Bacteroides difficilis]MBC5606195.1 hypothetical protein [Bacteroides difficilis]